MSSKRAKELKALATSLALVEDDLLQKRYFRKSQYYQETEQFKREKKAKELAAFNLLKDKQITPLISGVLSNAIVNAPPVVFGADEEKEEIIRTPVVSGTSNELRKAAAQLRRSASVPTTKRDIDLLKQIEDTKKMLKPLPPREFIPPEKRRPQTSSESEAEELKKGIFEKSPVRTQEQIDSIMSNLSAIVSKPKLRKNNFFTKQLRDKMTINQLQQVIKELEDRELALKQNPNITTADMVSYGKKVQALKDRLQQKQNPRRRGRPKKAGDPTEAGEAGVSKPKLKRESTASTLAFSGSEADTSEMEGEGMKRKFMKYYGNGKIKMTADMKKLLMIMGSINAGNDNPKLRVEYERLRKKIMKSVHSKMK
jgi:hypothetical protein